MQKRTVIFIAVALVAALVTPLEAQTIAGHVLDRTTHAPLRHVEIALVSDTGPTPPALVRTTGHAVMTTFKALRSTHADFVAAVRAYLPTARFEPAEIGRHKVPQVVLQPFDFCLTPSTDPPRRPDPKSDDAWWLRSAPRPAACRP